MLRRAEERSRVRAPAVIAEGGRVLDCMVCDLSPRGARLRVTDAGAVPAEFELIGGTRASAGRPACVERDGNEVGVLFTPERRAFGRRPNPLVPAAAGK
jgi:hypothetical protein